MEIITQSLPSTGWKSGLPATFDMRPFSGAESIYISQAIEEDSLTPLLLEALPRTLNINIDMLTIQDAHALLFQQRMMLDEFPLQLPWTCNMPLFEYSTGIYQEPIADELPLNTFPCDAHNLSPMREGDVTLLQFRAHSDEFDLPRMKNYLYSQESRFNWFVAHMGLNFDDNYAILEQQKDLKLFMRLSEWVTASAHGIPNTVELLCPVCRRESTRTWEMKARMFDNA